MKTQTKIKTINGISFLTASPRTPTTKALILCPEAFGATGHMQDVAHRLARLGYWVLLFPLYGNQNKSAQFSIAPHEKEHRQELLNKLFTQYFINQLQAIKTHLENEYQSISILGFSIGGYLAILAASVLKTDNLIVFYPNPSVNNLNYPNLESITPHIARTPANTLMLFGQNDNSIPEAEIQTYQQLAPHAVIKTYPQAQHGFFCNSRHTYNKIAAQAAWSEVLKLLK